VPLSAFSHFEKTTEPLSITHQGQFPASPSRSIWRRRLAGQRHHAIDKVQKDLHMPASVQAGFQGTAASFTNSLSNEPLLILAALVTVYIVLGVCTRASSTRSRFSRRCRRRASARCWR
jgi:multidrug efflux pump